MCRPPYAPYPRGVPPRLTGMALPRSPRIALGIALGVLTAANVLNNRLSPRATVPLSLGAAGLLVLHARRSGLTWPDLGLDPAHTPRGLRYGTVAAGGVGVVYAAGALLPATRPLFADQRAEQALPALLRQTLLDVPLGTVVLEEIGFRGVLPALCRKAYGPRVGEALPVALFGLWHILPSAALTESNPALAAATTGGAATRVTGAGARTGGHRRLVEAGSAVLTTALGGAVFATLRRRTGSLWAPALLHTAFNSLGYAAAWAVNGHYRRHAGES